MTRLTIPSVTLNSLQQFKHKDPSIKRFFDNAVGWVIYPTVGGQQFTFDPRKLNCELAGCDQVQTHVRR